MSYQTVDKACHASGQCWNYPDTLYSGSCNWFEDWVPIDEICWCHTYSAVVLALWADNPNVCKKAWVMKNMSRFGCDFPWSALSCKHPASCLQVWTNFENKKNVTTYVPYVAHNSSHKMDISLREIGLKNRTFPPVHFGGKIPCQFVPHY